MCPWVKWMLVWKKCGAFILGMHLVQFIVGKHIYMKVERTVDSGFLGPPYSLLGPHSLLPSQSPLCLKLLWPRQNCRQYYGKHRRVQKRLFPNASLTTSYRVKSKAGLLLMTSKSDISKAEWEREREAKPMPHTSLVQAGAKFCPQSAISWLLSASGFTCVKWWSDYPSHTVLQKAWCVMSLNVHARDTDNTCQVFRVLNIQLHETHPHSFNLSVKNIA